MPSVFKDDSYISSPFSSATKDGCEVKKRQIDFCSIGQTSKARIVRHRKSAFVAGFVRHPHTLSSSSCYSSSLLGLGHGNGSPSPSHSSASLSPYVQVPVVRREQSMRSTVTEGRRRRRESLGVGLLSGSKRLNHHLPSSSPSSSSWGRKLVSVPETKSPSVVLTSSNTLTNPDAGTSTHSQGHIIPGTREQAASLPLVQLISLYSLLLRLLHAKESGCRSGTASQPVSQSVGSKASLSHTQ